MLTPDGVKTRAFYELNYETKGLERKTLSI